MGEYAKLNRLLKCVTGGSRHRRHILTGQTAAKMCFAEERYPATRLPVCEMCERLALWGKSADGGRAGVCPACGTITADAMTYGEYLAQGYDVDKSVLSERERRQLERARSVFLP